MNSHEDAKTRRHEDAKTRRHEDAKTRRHEDTKTRRHEDAEGTKPDMNVEELSAIVVDRAFHIHKELGPGLLESVYESVLTRALERRGLRVERQKTVIFEYDGMIFNDGLRVDLLVNEKLIIELKSVEMLAPVHSKQLLTYLRLLNQPLGLLINFGAATFKEGCKRIVNGPQSFVSSRLRINNEP